MQILDINQARSPSSSSDSSSKAARYVTGILIVPSAFTSVTFAAQNKAALTNLAGSVLFLHPSYLENIFEERFLLYILRMFKVHKPSGQCFECGTFQDLDSEAHVLDGLILHGSWLSNQS